MNRPFYSDYVRPALRFYARNQSLSDFNTGVDKENWMACHRALKTWSKLSYDIFMSVYGGYDTLADEVYKASITFKTHQNQIWDDMKKLEKQIAKCRGLL